MTIDINIFVGSSKYDTNNDAVRPRNQPISWPFDTVYLYWRIK
jgi:hypothetical protein